MLQGVEGTVRRRTSQEAAHAGRAPVVGRACVRFASGLEQQLFRRWCLDALHAAGPIHGAATAGGRNFRQGVPGQRQQRQWAGRREGDCALIPVPRRLERTVRTGPIRSKRCAQTCARTHTPASMFEEVSPHPLRARPRFGAGQLHRAEEGRGPCFDAGRLPVQAGRHQGHSWGYGKRGQQGHSWRSR